MNMACLSGRLVADPQTNNSNGTPVSNFTLAVSNGRTDESGNYLTDFYKCACWGRLANRAQRLTKGSFAVVSGNIYTTHYTAQNGDKRTDLNVYATSLDYAPVKPAIQSNSFTDDLD